MRVLITGSAGMLGSAVYPAFAEQGHDVTATDLRPRMIGTLPMGMLDVRDADAVATAVNESYDLVLHLAAETDLEVCERNPDHAYATNTIGTKNVVEACIRHSTTLVYIGTAGIFDGKKESPYTESDMPEPINRYGVSKYLGEVATTRWWRSFVVRAGWMIGGDEVDHKFVGKIRAQIDRGAKTIYAVTDKLGTPTYTRDFASNLLELVATDWYGTYHMVCEGMASRYDVAVEICRILGSDSQVVPVSSEWFDEQYFAPRPRSEVLVNTRLTVRGINMMRPWQEALADYLTRSRS